MLSPAVCLGCHKTLDSPAQGDYYKCSKCNWPMCGKQCETSSHHVDECVIMKERKCVSTIRNTGKPKIESSYCVIVPLRIILLRTKMPKLFRSVMELTSHLEQRIDTNLYKVLRANLVPFIRDFLKISEYSERDILNIAGILDTNCFEVFLKTSQIRARGIYPITAMMAHECVTNTKHFVDDNLKMQVIACLPIKKGEMILTSYSHPLKTTMERLYQLKETKCFDCICPRCKDSTEMETFASAVKCSICNVGFVIPLDSLDVASVWKCEKCSHKFPPSQVLPILNKARSVLDSLNKKSVVECENYLKNHDPILPPTNVLMLEVKYALCLLYGNVFEFMAEDLSETQLNRKLTLCKELLSVFNNLEPGESNSVANVAFELCLCEILLRKMKSQGDLGLNLERARKAYNILINGGESKILMEKRMNCLVSLNKM